MTIKDKILEFLCLKTKMDNYQSQIYSVNKRHYKTTYEVNGYCHKSSSEIKCSHCKSVIKSGFRILLISHYVIENKQEWFLNDELKPFCNLCYFKKNICNEIR